ncbi:hypothetical protein [Nostoc sp. NMS8]|uniref:hypothetical protein n=1 Tax=Nostoc sp. NMS8 TaxID=2815392 RepID=UPI0025DC49A6|nr:hypothetical protein [Nostoc sp. NMS8]MBN3962172.1 hypothetical protein [Nostoc sp. NMS8]
MDEEMNLNLTKAKQSSLQEEITEPNESEINNTTFIESENNLMPSSEATLGAGMNPPPPPPPPKFP